MCAAAEDERPRRAEAVVEVDGVGWLLEKQDDGVVPVHHDAAQAYVEVTIPKDRTGDGMAPLVDLAPAVKKAIPEGIAD